MGTTTTRLILMLVGACLLGGCSRQATRNDRAAEYPELVTFARTEVAELAKAVEQPVIVEFSVLYGCDRCARMQPEVRKFAQEQADRIPVRRADFGTNLPLLQSLGATICPTYVLFTPDGPPQIHTSPEFLVSGY